MKILMMGPQGSGKGTIGSMISEFLNVPIVSTGNILRNIPKGHPWYKEINDTMSRGILVDQKKVVAPLLSRELEKERYQNGFVLDGWYRSMKDVEAYKVSLDVAFLLTISSETTIKRLSSRRTCSKCGEIFNTVTPSEKPKIDGVCDKCGGVLEQRQDDTEEAILKRLSIYHEETADVIDFLKEKNILIEVDGEGPPEEVFERIRPHLE
jgi:adenylate kinase